MNGEGESPVRKPVITGFAGIGRTRCAFRRFGIVCVLAPALVIGGAGGLFAGVYESPNGYKFEYPDDWKFFTLDDFSALKGVDPITNEIISFWIENDLDAGMWTKTGPISEALIIVLSHEGGNAVRPEDLQDFMAPIRQTIRMKNNEANSITDLKGEVAKGEWAHYVSCQFNLRLSERGAAFHIPMSLRYFCDGHDQVAVFGHNILGNPKELEKAMDKIARRFKFKDRSIISWARENLEMVIIFGGGGAVFLLVGLVLCSFPGRRSRRR